MARPEVGIRELRDQLSGGWRSRFRRPMASSDKVTVALDASIVAQAREQIGQRGDRLGDDAVVERALNAFLLRRTVEGAQAAAGLEEQEAEQVAYDELAALRRERRGAT
jgi:predicted transcriptional regulator